MYINKIKDKIIFETNPKFFKGYEISETLEIFNKIVTNFFDELSIKIFQNIELRKYPDLASFGFFCREANIRSLKKKYSKFLENRYGRGLALHFTPSNVPLNFAYSLFFGLITGNTNIIRLSTKFHRQAKILINIINSLLKKKKYKILQKKINIIRYDKSEYINKYLSSICDVRIIWGGDETINQIRNNPLPAGSFDVTFADKYSICIISSENYLKKKQFKKEALSFYNDTLFYDQNACTSPKIITWHGNKKNNKLAAQIFWREFEKIVRSKKYKIEGNWNYEKFYKEIRTIIDLNSDVENNKISSIKRIKLKKIPNKLNEYFTPGGFFIEFNFREFKKVKKLFNNKVQTLTYIGFEGNFLKNKLNLIKSKFVDRVVPNGKSSDMNLEWDGYDIIFQISKKLTVI